MNFISSTKDVPDSGAIPAHIAVIMDGNGRWATKRLLPRVAGHKKGVDTVRKIVMACVDRGVSWLTLFAFSSENWRRPPEEVSLLMRLFVTALEREVARMHANGIRLRVVGDLSRFDDRLRATIAAAEAKTAANTRLTVSICANYGGRWDIMQATGQALAVRRAAGLEGEALTAPLQEDEISRHLALAYAPEPDLFVRTGGEQRISNFMVWQLAYSELYFTDTYWPEFDAAQLDLAIASYQQRERRFGRTSGQIAEQKKAS